MESNYVKSARIKLQKLGITDYDMFKRQYSEVMEIVEDTLWKEFNRKIQESLTPYIGFTPGYGTFVDVRSIPELPPEKKPWQVQTLEHYTRPIQIERITL